VSLSLAIKEHALHVGFDLVGIAPLVPARDLVFARQWVERGYGGEMRYLKNPRRDDPRRILPTAKSVVCVGLVYNDPHAYSTEVVQAEGSRQKAEGSGKEHVPRGWISRYAWGEDYHDILRARLERLRVVLERLVPGVETRIFVDTGPIVERAFARYSGIGWMGKNTCLVNEAKGSWFFLGVMLTSLELEPDLPAPDRCGSCTACLEACPTGALVEPYVMDASRCISYFTIELKGSIPEQFRPAIGGNIFGCDICQDVCPWNWTGRSQESGVRSQKSSGQLSVVRGQQRKVATTMFPEFQPLRLDLPGYKSRSGEGTTSPAPNTQNREPDTRHLTPETLSLFNPPLEALTSFSEEDFRRLFANSPIKRAKYRGWLRNLCVAMGNSGNPRFIPWLQKIRELADPIVREHAEWALKRLEQA